MNKNIGAAGRKLRRFVVSVSVSVSVAAMVPGTSWAAGTPTTKATATLGSSPFANNTYGLGTVSGKAKLRLEDGRLKIEAEVQGLKPGTAHAGHIHFGDCKGLFPGEIVYDLKPVMIGRNGEGRSVTVIRDATAASLATVPDCGWWVAFHDGPANSIPQSPAVAIGPVLHQQR